VPLAKLSYELSAEADCDVENIYGFTANEYGTEQAIEYLNQLDMAIEGLGANPELGKQRTEIREGLRSFPQERHVIFYRVLSEQIRIVRILHCRRDLANLIPG
jgi:toxin ParE1/3/4